MNNPDVRRYERALGSRVQGLRCRKRVRKEFRKSLLLLLEEVPTPNYEDLEEAFGPPEQMAQDLMGTIPNLPLPISTRKKVGILIAFCLVAVAVGVGIYCWCSGPEVETTLLEGVSPEEKKDALNYMFCLNEAFSNDDYSWKQNKAHSDYWVFLENTNRVDTTIYISYDSRQPPHTFVVPAGEQRVFRVMDSRPTEHVISFSTPDGSMSGWMQVLIPKS